jgi:hypothetical protein
MQISAIFSDYDGTLSPTTYLNSDNKTGDLLTVVIKSNWIEFYGKYPTNPDISIAFPVLLN